MQLSEVLARAAAAPGPLVVLTGAGISAESGIPTFRGPEGYWTVGSRHYQPEEMATLAMFRRDPALVWSWYLHRRGRCRAAEPNAGHRGLVRLENAFADRFLLLTQNVDGLHLRAGNSAQRTLQVHGNLHFMRCAAECTPEPVPVPEGWGDVAAGERLPEDAAALLRCPRCGGWTRPHVLWFDEMYDEPRYRFESALAAAEQAALLLVVGTSGATNLPIYVGGIVARRGAAIVNVDPTPNPFAHLAERSATGCFIAGPAAGVLPGLVEACIAAFAP